MKAAKRFTAPPPIPAGNFMRRYNADMGKPFQFSMRGMLVFVALFCAAAWCVTVVHDGQLFGGVGWVAIGVFGATLGCAAGLFTRLSLGFTAFCGALLALFFFSAL